MIDTALHTFGTTGLYMAPEFTSHRNQTQALNGDVGPCGANSSSFKNRHCESLLGLRCAIPGPRGIVSEGVLPRDSVTDRYSSSCVGRVIEILVVMVQNLKYRWYTRV
jgi:hypothetical protein